MNKFAFCLTLAVLITASCTKKIYIPIEKVVYESVHDTTVLHSTDTIVRVKEFNLADYVGLQDTLTLSTDVATSKTWIDQTAFALKGRLVQTGTVPVRIVWKERTVTKDSVVTRDVPVPVVETKIVKTVPLLWRIFSAVGIASLAFAVFWVLRRFKVL